MAVLVPVKWYVTCAQACACTCAYVGHVLYLKLWLSGILFEQHRVSLFPPPTLPCPSWFRVYPWDFILLPLSFWPQYDGCYGGVGAGGLMAGLQVASIVGVLPWGVIAVEPPPPLRLLGPNFHLQHIR